MGLDISYFSKAILDSSGDRFYVNNSYFKYQLGSLKNNRYYNLSPESEYGSFCAGSYGGYNSWRNTLLLMVGYLSLDDVSRDFDPSIKIRTRKLKSIETGENIRINPFYEIIYFSDCEGAIGPEISRKLYKDFVDFDEDAKKITPYFYKKYCEFKEAFRVASDDGIVIFR